MRSWLIAVVSASALWLSSGCAVEGAEEFSDESSDLTARLSPADLARTKAELRRIANANMTRTDNFADVRLQVEPLIAKLTKHFGVRSAASKVQLVKGAWRQIWSDYPYPMNSVSRMDLAQVYQVVSPNGYYYNLGDSTSFFLFGTTGILRGEYALAGNKLNIRFTDVGYRFGRLSKGKDLVQLASSIESGDTSYSGIPGGGRAPRGPIGVSGTLETLYVDADLRIEQGTQNPVFDAQGEELQPGIGLKYFVLDRVTVPVK